MNDAALIGRYVELRDYVEAQQKEFDARMDPYKKSMEAIQGAMHARLLASGDQSVKTEAGTAYLSSTLSIKMADRESFMAFVLATGETSFLTAAVAKDAVKQYSEENGGALPPGLEATTFVKTNFRRS